MNKWNGMEGVNFVGSVRPPHHHRLPCFPQVYRVSSANNNNLLKKKKGRNRELISEFVLKNDDSVRSLPIYVGGFSLLSVLFNRTLSGIPPVSDASRADLLTIALAVTNILAGLVWLSIRPKTISPVPPLGLHSHIIHHSSQLVASELTWAWESLSTVTCTRSLVIVYLGVCILQFGYAASSTNDETKPMTVDCINLMQASIYQGVVQSGSQSYLANLSLYPGKSQLPFLPSNTQSVILQPLGDKGIAIIGGDTIRGFTTSDQAWITLIGEKLDATLSKHPTSYFTPSQ